MVTVNKGSRFVLLSLSSLISCRLQVLRSRLANLVRESAPTSKKNTSEDKLLMKMSNESNNSDAAMESKDTSEMIYSFEAKSSVSKSDDLNQLVIPRELQIATPYGHLAFKEWGNSNAPNKILCLHGWLDNSGSFDPLIPYLLDSRDTHDNYHILAWDEPGIGLSSHKPAGSDYSKASALIELKRTVDRLKWNKLSLLGHSMGSNHAFLFACLFPNLVENVISIDMTQPITTQTARGWETRSANAIIDYLKYEQQVEDDPAINDKIPVYSEKEALKRIMESHGASLNESSARIIMKRGAKKRRWGYTFTRDIRLRAPYVDPYPTDDAMLQYMKVFKANLLIIRGAQSMYQTSEAARKLYYELYQTQCRLFQELQLNGTHHLHMNDPKPVSEAIKSFLKKANSLKQTEEQSSSKSAQDLLTLTKSKL